MRDICGIRLTLPSSQTWREIGDCKPRCKSRVENRIACAEQQQREDKHVRTHHLPASPRHPPHTSIDAVEAGQCNVEHLNKRRIAASAIIMPSPAALPAAPPQPPSTWSSRSSAAAEKSASVGRTDTRPKPCARDDKRRGSCDCQTAAAARR